MRVTQVACENFCNFFYFAEKLKNFSYLEKCKPSGPVEVVSAIHVSLKKKNQSFFLIFISTSDCSICSRVIANKQLIREKRCRYY